ncbi:hypothetical protein [Leifsonia sp. 2MCAF36]|uniref:hypothetical protein n=1 Tax=Leifsonia sp. 2MCAF36 TaxID=3232988 RepID=UPI003F9DCC16
MTTQPLRVGVLARRRLARLARRDAAAVHDTEPDRADATTPTVATLQARADAYARREEQRFFRRMRRELTEHRVLVSALRSDIDAYDRQLERISDAGGEAAARPNIAEGRGPAFEELRRLERRIRRAHRRADELSALINSRFTAAQLRAARMFDRSDEKTALYWGALREATAGRVAPRPPALRRSEWLTARGTAVDALHPISESRTVDTIREHDADTRRTDART